MKENIFKTVYLNFVFRDILENDATHSTKSPLSIDELIEDVLPRVCTYMQ